jgi:hypothetical protein
MNFVIGVNLVSSQRTCGIRASSASFPNSPNRGSPSRH